MGHVIFTILHIIAFFSGAILLIVTVPLHIIYSNMTSSDTKTNQTQHGRRAIEDGMKKCPYCAEIIQGEAIICKHCDRDVSDVKPPSYKTCPYCGLRNRHEGDKCIRCGKDIIGA